MGEVGQRANNERQRAEFAEHLTTISDIITALSEAAVDVKEVIFAARMIGDGHFYMDNFNRFTKKSSNAEAHPEKVKCLDSVWAELQVYFKEHHTPKLILSFGVHDAEPPKRRRF